MDILRFITAGSVDDGKSTLIGRLLYDTSSILDDQLEAIKRASKHLDEGQIDLSLLTDGLRAEREQGITIDVAYKYFNTQRRKFIIADTPGHIQYTRNMVTGASNSNLVIILVDARNGVVEQTRRHSFLCSLLGIPRFVVCINKMDLVDYSQEVYERIVADYRQFAAPLDIKDVAFIPVSALEGDNIVDHSMHMNWYTGKSLMQFLEEVPVEQDINLSQPRFQVQWVIRPQTKELHDYRGYAGRVTSGIYRKGDEVTVLPAGLTSRIKAIEFDQKEIREAFAPMSVVLHLEDDIDISRGDMIVSPEDVPHITQDLTAKICWMDTKPLTVGAKYLLQHNSMTTRCAIKNISYKVNINTLEKVEGVKNLLLNDIAEVVIRTASPVFVDDYTANRGNGAFILVDESTHVTVGAGMIELVPVALDDDF